MVRRPSKHPNFNSGIGPSCTIFLFKGMKPFSTPEMSIQYSCIHYTNSQKCYNHCNYAWSCNIEILNYKTKEKLRHT